MTTVRLCDSVTVHLANRPSEYGGESSLPAWLTLSSSWMLPFSGYFPPPGCLPTMVISPLLDVSLSWLPPRSWYASPLWSSPPSCYVPPLWIFPPSCYAPPLSGFLPTLGGLPSLVIDPLPWMSLHSDHLSSLLLFNHRQISTDIINTENPKQKTESTAVRVHKRQARDKIHRKLYNTVRE